MSVPRSWLLLLLAFAPACDGIDVSERRSGRPGDPAAAEAAGPRALDVSRPPFQLKSSTQLARSLAACVGAKAVTVAAPIIITPTNTAGFLTSDFAEGNDIVAVQAPLFDGTPESLRTGVRVDQVTLEYVTALKNVANVVGSRCAAGLTESPQMCTCAGEAEAKEMLTRCLSAVVDPLTPEFGALARDFAGACAKNPGSAIASMIASLAFAKVP